MSDTQVVKAGSTAYLNYQAEDGKTGLFPRAILRDETGATLAASPIDLTEVADGLYIGNVAMPNIPQMKVTLIPYIDAARTIEDQLHGRDLDLYNLDVNAATLDQILTLVQAQSGALVDLEGTLIDDGFLEGSIEEDPEMLAGAIDDDGALIGVVEDPDILDGVLGDPDETLEGILNDC